MSLRRDLRFNTLDDVLAELDRLESSSVQTVGRWSFYQILTHVGSSMDYSITAYPRLMPVIVRKTVGPLAFRHMMKKGLMAEGAPNPDAPREREEGDAVAAMQNLRSAIERFRRHTGDVAVHPFFGVLSKEDYTRLHAYHASLHLSFAHPDDTVARQAPNAFGALHAKKKAASRTAPSSSKKARASTVKKATKKATRKAPARPAKKAAKKTAARGRR